MLVSTSSNDYIAAIVFLAIIGAVLLLALWAVIRWIPGAWREFWDTVWVIRRGTLTPIQVREEFLAVEGREPTIEEVHALHDMIKSEHSSAVKHMFAIAAGIGGTLLVFHRALHRERIF